MNLEQAFEIIVRMKEMFNASGKDHALISEALAVLHRALVDKTEPVKPSEIQ